MNEGARVHLVLCVLGLVLLCNHSVHGACFRVGNIPREVKAPFLEMKISEFPDEDVIPTGSNVTIVCTSNISVPENEDRRYGETYWMPFYFYDSKATECGGRNDDSEESKTCKLHITNGTQSDSGDYSCQAHNHMGYCSEATLTLTFKEPSPPHFTAHPGHQLNVSTGNAANLACEASGVPRPVITWLKDGRHVSGASVKQVKGSSILTFESVSPSDQGVYWCEARNTEGSNTSSTANMTVWWKPVFLVHPTNISIHENDNVTLSCKAAGFPRPVISWLKNNMSITNATLVQNGSVSSLSLHLVKREDIAGKYKCIARNPVGETVSTEGTLKIVNFPIWWKPVFSVHPANISIHENDNVTLSCEAAGFPRPVISWLKNNIPITDATLIQNGTYSSLHLVKGEEKAGKYKCIARNSMGETVSTEGALRILNFASVRRGPSFYRHPVSTTTSRDSTVRFTCAAQGSPLPTITWLKDGKAIADEDADFFQKNDTSILSIRAVHERHVGRYWCVATSSVLNASSRKATLFLKEPSETNSLEVVWISVSAAVVALLCLVMAVIFFKQRRRSAASYKLNKELGELTWSAEQLPKA